MSLRSIPAILLVAAGLATAVATLAVLTAGSGDEPSGAVAAADAPPAVESVETLVGEAYIAGSRDGRPMPTLAGPVRELWAFFRFTTLPERGSTVSVRWRMPDGELGPPIAKERTRRVVALLRDREALAPGVWHALLYVGGVVAKDVRVEIAE